MIALNRVNLMLVFNRTVSNRFCSMGKLDVKNMKHWQAYQYGCVSGKAP